MITRVIRPALLVVLLAVTTTACQVLPADQPEPPAGPLTDQLAALPIAPEDTGAHYDRDDWLPQWARSGECTTRETVLRQQGQDVVVDAKCAPTSGRWVSEYDGVTVTDPKKLDIDHIVPLAEVTRSGPIVDGRRQRPGNWPADQRHAYANDIDGLVAVTASSNRSKGDDDPARWLPDQNRCDYVTKWLHIKTKYQLSIDQHEHDAIASVITTCPT